jgi:CheY-like chemotaxis protein
MGSATTEILARVTIVDDNAELVDVLADVFRGRFHVTAVRPRTIADLSATLPHLMFIDALTGMQDGGSPVGWQLVEQARADEHLREVPIILCTGQIGLDGDLDQMARHANVHMLAKPFELDVLEATVARAMVRDS